MRRFGLDSRREAFLLPFGVVGGFFQFELLALSKMSAESTCPYGRDTPYGYPRYILDIVSN